LYAGHELLKIELSKTEIRAPFSGRVGMTQLHSGAWVAAGSPLVELQDQGTVKIQFPVSEKYAEVLRFGRKISFSTINNLERYTAIITGTEAGIDRNTRNITVYATTNNTKSLLKPGMSVRIYFPTANENALGFLLPTQALMAGGNGYSVFAVKNGVAKATAVRIGNRTESDALITSGLSEGDTVMISNILRTVEGTPVQAVTAN
jgi:membrane fusion protein, multidrug efflux system